MDVSFDNEAEAADQIAALEEIRSQAEDALKHLQRVQKLVKRADPWMFQADDALSDAARLAEEVLDNLNAARDRALEALDALEKDLYGDQSDSAQHGTYQVINGGAW